MIVDQFIECYKDSPDCALGRVGDADSVLMGAAELVECAKPIMIARASAAG